MNKRKVLVSLYAYYPFENANTNIMQPLLEKMKESFDVTIFTRRNDKSVEKTESRDGIKIIRYDKPNCLMYPFIAVDRADMHKKRVLWKRVAIIPLRFISRTLRLSEKTDEFRMLRFLIKTNNYDLVLATCETYGSMINVLRFKKSGLLNRKMVSYFMDPHAYYIGNAESVNHFVEEEREIYEHSDLILTTEEIFRENHINAFRDYLYKTKPIPFGNLRINNSARRIQLSEKINCVFAGSLIDLTVRSPEYFYKIIGRLDSRFQFYFICKRINDENKRLFKHYLGGLENVALLIDLSLSDSLSYMESADILINFGNKTANQTPSKIFDYISTGLPIVNIYSIEGDTAMFYLKDYDYTLNIFEEESEIEKNAQCFSDFCIDNQYNRMSRIHISEVYRRHTHEAVSGLFLNEIERICEL